MIVFKNDGEIDVRGITTFGVSSKDIDKPVGFFGTGLKYAISVLLRTGHEVAVYSGEFKYIFTLKRETIRNDDFNIIHMNGEPLGFTTHLGVNWEVWQAYRELYCNATDEAGSVYLTNEAVKPEAGKTFVLVKGAAFTQEYHNRDRIILNKEPRFTSADCNILLGESQWIYYKGVRTMEVGRSSLTYDIRCPIDLTEDRTFKYQYEVKEKIADAIVATEDEDIIEKAILSWSEAAFEDKLDFSSVTINDTLRAVIQRNIGSDRLNKSVFRLIDTGIEDVAASQPEAVLSDLDKKRLEKAIIFCKFIQFPVDEFPIVAVDKIAEGVMALADQKRKKMFITRAVFDEGTKFLARALIEEYIHLKYDQRDCTREMQNTLFRTITSLGEELMGELL